MHYNTTDLIYKSLRCGIIIRSQRALKAQRIKSNKSYDYSETD